MTKREENQKRVQAYLDRHGVPAPFSTLEEAETVLKAEMFIDEAGNMRFVPSSALDEPIKGDTSDSTASHTEFVMGLPMTIFDKEKRW